MDDELRFLDATEQAMLVENEQLTPAELVDAAIERLEALNPVLNAVVHPDLDRARDRASAETDSPTDRRHGHPFAGVPFLMKDLVCHEAGLPFHEGNVHLRDIGWTPDHDQALAVRFRESGLISLGRTNVSEFGMRPVCEPVAYGPTNNPWDLARSPGGSTGGGAAAVASGIVAVAHANDVGGSIRAPASHCGLVGLKPSRARSTQAPDFFDAMGGLNEDLVVTRSVRDTAAVLDAVCSRPEVGDWHPSWPPSPSYVGDAATHPGHLRIGFLATHERTPVHPDVAGTVRAVAAVLSRSGHHVDESHPAALDEDVGRFLLPHYTAGTAWIVDEHWPRVLGHPIPDDELEETTVLLRELGRTVSGAGLLAAREAAQAWTRRLVSWWSAHDVLLCPVVPVPPPLTGGEHDDAHLISCCAPFNLSGQPAISVPGAVVDGLPIGVQLVAAHGREDVLIRLAAQLEEVTGWLDRHPPDVIS
jgi:amidase